MSHALIVRSRAERDIAEAGFWYEARRPGTGLRFVQSVDAAISMLIRHPEAGAVQFGPFRRILIARFPFGVYYTIEEKTVVVHAIYHLSRDPAAIRRLLKSESDESMS